MRKIVVEQSRAADEDATARWLRKLNRNNVRAQRPPSIVEKMDATHRGEPARP